MENVHNGDCFGIFPYIVINYSYKLSQALWSFQTHKKSVTMEKKAKPEGFQVLPVSCEIFYRIKMGAKISWNIPNGVPEKGENCICPPK